MKEEGVRGGRSRWSLLMAAKAQVNVEPVLRDISAGHGSQARALSCGPSSSSSLSSFSSFILHPPLSPAGPGAGTEAPLLCTRGPGLSVSQTLSFPPLSASLSFSFFLFPHTPLRLLLLLLTTTPLSFPLKVSSLHKYEIIGKIELAASGDSGQNV